MIARKFALLQLPQSFAKNIFEYLYAILVRQASDMTELMNLNIRIRGNLREFVVSNIGNDGLYDNASEYVRDLIRKDMARSEEAAFEKKRLALQQAFALPDESYRSRSAEEVIARNRPADG